MRNYHQRENLLFNNVKYRVFSCQSSAVFDKVHLKSMEASSLWRCTPLNTNSVHNVTTAVERVFISLSLQSSLSEGRESRQPHRRRQNRRLRSDCCCCYYLNSAHIAVLHLPKDGQHVLLVQQLTPKGSMGGRTEVLKSVGNARKLSLSAQVIAR